VGIIKPRAFFKQEQQANGICAKQNSKYYIKQLSSTAKIMITFPAQSINSEASKQFTNEIAEGL
jgi:hypothetical protein